MVKGKTKNFFGNISRNKEESCNLIKRKDGDKQKYYSPSNPKQNRKGEKCVICDRVTGRDNINGRRLDFASDRPSTCDIKQ